jgi:flavin-binding protein dodecin
MATGTMELEVPSACVVSVDGLSDVSWRDAVWNAILPAVRAGYRVVGFDVARHSMTVRNAIPEYRVHVRLTVT